MQTASTDYITEINYLVVLNKYMRTFSNTYQKQSRINNRLLKSVVDIDILYGDVGTSYLFLGLRKNPERFSNNLTN